MMIASNSKLWAVDASHFQPDPEVCPPSLLVPRKQDLLTNPTHYLHQELLCGCQALHHRRPNSFPSQTSILDSRFNTHSLNAVPAV